MASNSANFAPTFAYYVNFLSGFVFNDSKSNTRRVRAVRGGSS